MRHSSHLDVRDVMRLTPSCDIQITWMFVTSRGSQNESLRHVTEVVPVTWLRNETTFVSLDELLPHPATTRGEEGWGRTGGGGGGGKDQVREFCSHIFHWGIFSQLYAFSGVSVGYQQFYYSGVIGSETLSHKLSIFL